MTDIEFIAMLWAHPELWPEFKRLLNETSATPIDKPTSAAEPT